MLDYTIRAQTYLESLPADEREHHMESHTGDEEGEKRREAGIEKKDIQPPQFAVGWQKLGNKVILMSIQCIKPTAQHDGFRRSSQQKAADGVSTLDDTAVTSHSFAARIHYLRIY